MEQTPASLLERLRQPLDHAAWQRFVTLYTPLLNHFAQRLGLHGPDAEDLVQDVFTLLVRKMPDFAYDHLKSFRGWLWTLTLNKHRERLRRQGGMDPEVARALGQLAGPDEATMFEQAEYQHYLVGRALRVMQGEFQPATWRACLALVVDGQSPAAVAAELGLSVASVYAAKSRVLRRLRHELAGLLD